MKCKEANALFSEYIDGILPQDSLQELEEHLAACAGCRNELDAWKQADTMLSGVLDTEAVPTVPLEAFVAICTAEDKHEEGVLGKLAQWLNTPRRRVTATIAGSMALTALLLILVTSSTSQPTAPNKIECDRSFSPRGYIALGQIDCLTEGSFRNDF